MFLKDMKKITTGTYQDSQPVFERRLAHTAAGISDCSRTRLMSSARSSALLYSALLLFAEFMNNMQCNNPVQLLAIHF
jgi:hypothetical protein